MYFNYFDEVEVLFGYRSGDNGTVMSTRNEGIKQICDVRFSNFETHEYESDDLTMYDKEDEKPEVNTSCVFEYHSHCSTHEEDSEEDRYSCYTSDDDCEESDDCDW